MQSKIIIHPFYQPIWCSYFFRGLIDIYGLKSIQFSKKEFNIEIEERSDIADSGYMHFIIQSGDRQKKFVIDTMDSPSIDKVYLDWCDVYGKVNYDIEEVKACNTTKIIGAGPHVPIRHLGLFHMLLFSLKTFSFGHKSYIGHFKKHLKYPFSYNRLNEYYPKKSEKNYVFLNSALWKNNTETNDIRANFMIAARQINGITFEGGFIDRKDLDYYPDLRTQKLNKQSYLKKLSKSIAVFTNASVLGAHSFRICEYLAMGKAILSPPFIRELQRPLTHGENIHIAEPTIEGLREAIALINNDDAYRQKLENGARKYFEEICQPTKLMKGIIDFEPGAKNVFTPSSSLPLAD